MYQHVKTVKIPIQHIMRNVRVPVEHIKKDVLVTKEDYSVMNSLTMHSSVKTYLAMNSGEFQWSVNRNLDPTVLSHGKIKKGCQVEPLQILPIHMSSGLMRSEERGLVNGMIACFVIVYENVVH